MTPAGTRRDAWARPAFAAAVIANLAILYSPRAVSQGGIPYADKAVHIAIFALVAATGVLARVPLAWLVGLLAANALGSELVQHWLLAHRSGDPLDVAADLAGVAVGLVLGRKLAERTGVATGPSGGSLPT